MKITLELEVIIFIFQCYFSIACVYNEEKKEILLVQEKFSRLESYFINSFT